MYVVGGDIAITRSNYLSVAEAHLHLFSIQQTIARKQYLQTRKNMRSMFFSRMRFETASLNRLLKILAFGFCHFLLRINYIQESFYNFIVDFISV